ncbi:MAG: FeoA family protein [Acidithiobacillales bacterium]
MRRGLKKGASRTPPRTLADLRSGEEAVLEALELPPADARRLMELGFLPGTVVGAGRAAPGGDPRVFRVDGSEVALRRTTARQIRLKATRRAP